MESWASTSSSARLGPCELQDPLWAKMSSALANTTGVTKKRKKSDTNSQAQKNKCENEKRRREQENIYIEELAELISANFPDMSSISVKPDKCAILQETVNQIRSIRQRESSSSAASSSAASSTDPVQQGEVSSSKPTILSNEIFGPLLLEALEGFLFVVNTEGKVEHVTDNVATYIKFSRDEVHGKSIYNFIHHGDHARFSSNLLPMSIGWTSGDSSCNSNNPNPSKSRSFSCRLLVKSDEHDDECMEEKQQRVSQYEVMHISSTQLRQISNDQDLDEASAVTPHESGPRLLCVASRITYRDKVVSSAAIEQFTTKLDTSGKIIGVDVSGISVQYTQFLNKDLMGSALQELCAPQDVHKLSQHLRDTISTGQATSCIYRLRIGADKFIQVQTKSKLFKPNPNSSSNDSDFVMATHSIISENDCTGPPDPGGGNASNSLGGPLMTSVVNGTRNGSNSMLPLNSESSSTNNMMNANSFSTSFGLDSDSIQFNFPEIFPTSSWGDTLDSSSWCQAAETSRPNSRQSVVTPVSTPTPRPPSAPAYSPVAPIAQSPLFSQPSPNVPYTSTSYSSYSPMNDATTTMSGGFPLTTAMDNNATTAERQKQQDNTKASSVQADDNAERSAMIDSAKLRNLLTKPPTSANSTAAVSDAAAAANDSNENINKHMILKKLLNQSDEDENRNNRNLTRNLVQQQSSGGVTPELPKSTAAGGMLLQLLNEKNDDDDLEQRAGLKKRSELLQELLKDEASGNSNNEKSSQNQGDALLQSLGFSSPSPPGSSNLGGADAMRARKRSSDEAVGGDDIFGGSNAAKRASDGSQVSSSGGGGSSAFLSSSASSSSTSSGSKLCEKNKMLASLLAKTPSNHQPIPPIPASVISATPQEKLPRITDPNLGKVVRPGGSMGSQNVNHQQQQQQRRLPGRPPNTNYLNQILTPETNNNNNNSNQQQQRNQLGNNRTAQFNSRIDSSTYPSPATSTGSSMDSNAAMWAEQSSDPLLSSILDQVIEIVPDAEMTNQNDIQKLLDAMSPQSNTNTYAQNEAMSEKMAITMIQKSLMQCESAVKNPSSPNVGMSGSSPAYNPQQGFQPPPNYPRMGAMQQQQQQRGQRPLYQLTNQQQQQILMQRKQLQQQQENKRRLLERQRDQQLVIPSNAAAEMNPGLQNIENLLNNTVAPPNVSLQRSSSLTESQLSPTYNSQQQQQQQQRVSNQQQQPPYSPHSQLASPLGQQQQQMGNFQQQGASRLSPHPPQFSQQLSPRQTFNAQQNQNSNWQQQQQAATAGRLSVQQQQNPMLNAQLTGNYVSGPNGRGYAVQRAQQQQNRSVGSPGTATRHSPFADSFPPPASPNSGGYSQSQYLRLQRANSAPSATTQLPGGLASPRQYATREHPSLPPPPHPSAQQQQQQHSPHSYSALPPPNTNTHHPQHPASHPQPPPHHHPMMYQQQDSPYCYDQSGLQLQYNGAESRGRLSGAAHLQAGGAGGPSSEYVRQEIRSMVGARSGQQLPQQQNNANNNAAALNSRTQQSQQQQNMLNQNVNAADLEALGINFEMPQSSGGASESPKLWGAIGSDMGSMSPPQAAASRNIMEEGRQGDHNPSLLQKLLSE